MKILGYIIIALGIGLTGASLANILGIKVSGSLPNRIILEVIEIALFIAFWEIVKDEKEWLSCGVNNLRSKIWRFRTRIKFVLTGNCGLNCGMTTFKKFDGTPMQQFVPEADCPIHDLQLKEN